MPTVIVELSMSQIPIHTMAAIASASSTATTQLNRASTPAPSRAARFVAALCSAKPLVSEPAWP